MARISPVIAQSKTIFQMKFRWRSSASRRRACSGVVVSNFAQLDGFISNEKQYSFFHSPLFRSLNVIAAAEIGLFYGSTHKILIRSDKFIKFESFTQSDDLAEIRNARESNDRNCRRQIELDLSASCPPFSRWLPTHSAIRQMIQVVNNTRINYPPPAESAVQFYWFDESVNDCSFMKVHQNATIKLAVGNRLVVNQMLPIFLLKRFWLILPFSPCQRIVFIFRKKKRQKSRQKEENEKKRKWKNQRNCFAFRFGCKQTDNRVLDRIEANISSSGRLSVCLCG